MSWPFSSLAPPLSLSELCWETSLGGMGVETVGPCPPRGELAPSPPAPGDRPPPTLRAWWRGSEDMDMEVIPGTEPELAIRLGSLQTEVGGATRAMSGMENTGVVGVFGSHRWSGDDMGSGVAGLHLTLDLHWHQDSFHSQHTMSDTFDQLCSPLENEWDIICCCEWALSVCAEWHTAGTVTRWWADQRATHDWHWPNMPPPVAGTDYWTLVSSVSSLLRRSRGHGPLVATLPGVTITIGGRQHWRGHGVGGGTRPSQAETDAGVQWSVCEVVHHGDTRHATPPNLQPSSASGLHCRALPGTSRRLTQCSTPWLPDMMRPVLAGHHDVNGQEAGQRGETVVQQCHHWPGAHLSQDADPADPAVGGQG